MSLMNLTNKKMNHLMSYAHLIIRDALSMQLLVKISLSAATSRLNKAREERDQFDEASNQIVLHLKTKEDELSKSVASCKVESDIVHYWINFLEDTWVLQSSYAELKDKQTNDELEKCGNSLVKVTKHHLVVLKEELEPSIGRIRTFVEKLKKFNDRSELMPDADNDISKESYPKKFLEDYLSAETKIVTAFSVADSMKKLFYSEHGNISRRDDPDVRQLFDTIDGLRIDFESIERPTLEIELPGEKVNPSEEKSQRSSSGLEIPQEKEASPKEKAEKSSLHSSGVNSPKSRAIKSPKTSQGTKLDAESELAKLEQEFGEASKDYTNEEIGGWEFDELEQELRFSYSEGNK